MNTLLAGILICLITAAPAAPDPVTWMRAASQAEQEYRYAEALTLYTRILKDAPGHFVARKAQARGDELRANQDAGFVPYARFQRLLQNYAALGSDKSVADARDILAAFPRAAIAPEIQAWLGNEYRETRRDPAGAMREYRIVIDRYPESPHAPIAMDRIGRMLEARGRFSEAAKLYAEMQQLYPEAATPKAYAVRREQVQKNIWRKRTAAASWSVLALSTILFAGVGGWRFDRRRWKEQARSKIGFALFIGLSPAAFLWITDDQWSASLTVMGVAFALYGSILAALASRKRVPAGAWLIFLERLAFNVLAPLSILYLIVHGFQFWEAFYF